MRTLNIISVKTANAGRTIHQPIVGQCGEKFSKGVIPPLGFGVHDDGMERLLFAVLIVLVWWAFDVTNFDGAYTSDLLKSLHAAWEDTRNIVARLRR